MVKRVVSGVKKKIDKQSPPSLPPALPPAVPAVPVASLPPATSQSFTQPAVVPVASHAESQPPTKRAKVDLVGDVMESLAEELIAAAPSTGEPHAEGNSEDKEPSAEEPHAVAVPVLSEEYERAPGTLDAHGPMMQEETACDPVAVPILSEESVVAVPVLSEEYERTPGALNEHGPMMQEETECDPVAVPILSEESVVAAPVLSEEYERTPGALNEHGPMMQEDTERDPVCPPEITFNLPPVADEAMLGVHAPAPDTDSSELDTPDRLPADASTATQETILDGNDSSDEDNEEIPVGAAAESSITEVFFYVIGDAHFSGRNQVQLQAMVENSVETVQRLTALAADLGGPGLAGIVLLGDLVDRFHMKSLAQATAWVWRLRAFAPVYLLVGNHDRPDHSHFQTDDHPFHGISHWEGVHVVERAEVFDIAGHQVLMVPYVPDGRLDEAIATVGPVDDVLRPVTCAFMHQTVYNAVFNGITSSTGDRWALSRPFTFSGHIHEYARVQANWIYAGSAYQIKFGEPEDNAAILVRLRAACDERSPLLAPLQSALGIPVRGATVEATHPLASRVQFQRMPLGVPVKRSVTISLADLSSFQYADGPDVAATRVIIRGPPQDILLASQNPKNAAILRPLQRNPRVVLEWSSTARVGTVPEGTVPEGTGEDNGSAAVGPRWDPAATFLGRLRTEADRDGFRKAYDVTYGAAGLEGTSRFQHEKNHAAVDEEQDVNVADGCCE